MNRLIVRNPEGHVMTEQAMVPADRYLYYQALSVGDLVSFHGRRYKLPSVAWTKPQQDLVLCVSFDSFEPLAPASSDG
jgi:hypothetical protein